MYSKLLFLLFVGAQFIVHAADETLAFEPPSPKRQIQMARVVTAVRSGTLSTYRPMLEALKKPTREIAFFDRENGRSSTITPMQLCIDAIFDRPQHDKLPLIHAMHTSLIQRCPELLTTACHEDILPYVYAYQKLPDTNSFDPWVPELFTTLARKVAADKDYAHPAMICALTTQILSWDEDWQKEALEIVYKSPLVLSKLHHELRRRTQGVNLSNIMLTNGLPFIKLARVCVQELATADVNLAFRHCLQLLQSPVFQESPDAQMVKDNLLFWAVENQQISREFVTHLLAHGADPYAVKPQRGIMTPLQKSLEVALKTVGEDQQAALTTLQTLLNVDESASKLCTIMNNAVLQKTYTREPQVTFADNVRFKLREQIGMSFCSKELKPFLQHRTVWEQIVARLRGDIEGARCAIYDIIADKTIEHDIEVTQSVLMQPLFKRLVLALETEKFCMLAAHNMADSRSAFDLYGFLSIGQIRQVYSDDEIAKLRAYTDVLYNTLSRNIRDRIQVLVKRLKT